MQREQSFSPAPPPPGWKIYRHLKVAGKSHSFASMVAAALPSTRVVIVLSIVFSLLAAAVSVPWINSSLIISSTTGVPAAITISKTSIITSNGSFSDKEQPAVLPPPPSAPPPAIIPFSCPAANQTKSTICRAIPSIQLPEKSLLSPPPLPSSCPDYFRWIHEDLKPWRRTGITKEMVERAGRTANFRLVILGGRVFVQRLRPSFQTRDVFTLWGLVQLLRRYPGRVPDLDLMFDTVDYPVVKAADYRGRNASAAAPPLFRYCSDDSSLDVVFPDWSFWGWPEINIKPWEKLKKELKEGNEKIKWTDREPYAYWKGNPAVAATRRDLLRCNVSQSHDWNARLYAQDWQSETHKGFNESNLASQCIHRFKIYIEGSAWSVSEKYILACNSMTLIVKPQYYDFFTRGLMPVQHYWPVRQDDKCRSIKFAVDWANSHKRKAQAIGNEASDFIHEKLKMDYVYDYMFHLLNEYAKLLKFKPTKSRRAIELCAETMACSAQNLTKQFMMDSMVKSPHASPPCSLSPPFSPVELRVLQRRKANSIKQVEIWEQRAWESQSSNN
ncbi:hypothetical protein M5K25_001372 [Dendrobium thyrsiflorum]|uniref:Glycosyl transferase CAP10 domain-containing protein n=1 Tax=Dendrobium thyrsiflorum TaxID=117978 RepID=A0ABD0VQA8_DENTH